MNATQLRDFMKANALSAPQLAAALGISRRHVYYLLAGEVEIKPIYSELLNFKFSK